MLLKNGQALLEESIAAAESKAPQTKAAIKETGAEIEQLVADLKTAWEDRTDATSAVEEATALRERKLKNTQRCRVTWRPT